MAHHKIYINYLKLGHSETLYPIRLPDPCLHERMTTTTEDNVMRKRRR